MVPFSLKKHPATRFAHYLYLLPFLPALRPLLINFSIRDMAIYLAGILLVVSLVIYGNQRPLIRAERDGLMLYLHYRHEAESHPFSGIRGWKRRSATRLTLESENHRPVTLRLKKTDADRLAALLEGEGIHGK